MPQRTPRLALLLTLFAAAACTDDAVAPTATPTGSAPRASVSSSMGTPTGRTVVVFKDTTAIPASGLTLISTLGGTISTRFDEIGVAVVSGLSTQALATLEGSDLVASVGADRLINWLPRTVVGVAEAGGVDEVGHNNPAAARYYADGRQYGPRMIRADRAWAAGIQGTPTTRVAILDTGVDYDHRELAGLVDHSASANFATLAVCEADLCAEAPTDPQQPGDQPYMDNHFHGTHVAATVASNNISVAGVAPHVTLIAVKVLSSIGSGSFEGVAAGIRHAAGPANADVINMSLGANVDATMEGVPALLELMRRTIRYAEKQGAIVISAAGNDALNLDVGNLVSTPCEQSTLCISATGPLLQQDFDQAATYTNYGITAIHLAAPGGNATDDDAGYQTEDLIIGACSRRTSEPGLAVCRGNTDGVVYFYAWAAGTSMAAPHAAGAAALVKSHFPTLSVNGLRSKLLHSADDVQAAGRDVYTNWGRINVARALGLE